MLLSFGIDVPASLPEGWNSNAWFGNARRASVDATGAELEAGNEDGVLRSLRTLQQKYSPTYENQARYDVLIEETVAQMRPVRTGR